MRMFLLSGLLALGLSACVSPSHTAYVGADRLTFDAVAPEYLRYVEADPSLDGAAKERRKRTIESWRLRIKKGGE